MIVEHGGVDANVLVIANETVVSEELLGRIRERAKEGPASFLIVSPQSDREGDDETEADRRLRRALTELRSDGIEAHGQIVHPDPFTAVMHATNDERIDEIIVSTFPGERSGWLRRDLIARLREKTGLPVQHVVVDRRWLMSAAAEAHGHGDGHEQHGPPPIHYSSRVSPSVLGMFLFIGSEIMLFGSFFTVYFFDRVVNHGVGGALAARAVPPPGLRRAASTR